MNLDAGNLSQVLQNLHAERGGAALAFCNCVSFDSSVALDKIDREQGYFFFKIIVHQETIQTTSLNASLVTASTFQDFGLVIHRRGTVS